MNIFLLHSEPWEAASYLHDKHVVKMGLEATQIACTALSLVDPPTYNHSSNLIYKPTHTSHPWVVWAAQSESHIYTVTVWGSTILNEYFYRYNRVHASGIVIARVRAIVSNPRVELLPIAESAPPLCMPPEYQDESSPILSYRRYYANEKCNNNPRWTRREAPLWLEEVTL